MDTEDDGAVEICETGEVKLKDLNVPIDNIQALKILLGITSHYKALKLMPINFEQNRCFLINLGEIRNDLQDDFHWHSTKGTVKKSQSVSFSGNSTVEITPGEYKDCYVVAIL